MQIESNRELRKGYRDLQQSIQREPATFQKDSKPLLALLTVISFVCVTAGSKDDLGDFSKDSLQEALGNANLLHERGEP